jgi:transcription initiation factor IIF auxiliary subunit
MTFIDTWPRSFKDNITDTKKDFHEAIVNMRKDLHQAFNHRIQGTHAEIEATKTPVDTCGEDLRRR